MNLNRRKAFVREYLKDNNGKQAAIRAGYSKKTAEVQASQLLRDLKVREQIERNQKVLQEKSEISATWVINNFKEIAERCMQKGMTEDDFDAAGANKALECIGKTLGMFVDKHEVAVSGRMIFVRAEKK
jgi:phage terminase small subunit